MFLYGAGLEQDEATAAQWASAAANSGLQDIIFTYFYTVTRSGWRMSTPLYSVCSMNFRYVPHFEEAQYLMGTMLLSGQGERAFQIGCLRSCRFGGVSCRGVSKNCQVWNKIWPGQLIGLNRRESDLPSAIGEIQPSAIRQPCKDTSMLSTTWAWCAEAASCCECHQQRFSRQNIPSFLFQCLLASLSILLDFGWLCYDCSILFSKGFRKAKTVKRGKDLPGGRFWQRKQHCLAALQVLLPRLESGDGVPEETQGSSRKSVWVFSGFDKIIPIFDTSMITWHGIGSQRHCHFWMWTK